MEIAELKNKVLMLILHWVERLVDGYFAIIPRSKPCPAYIKRAALIAHRGAHHHKNGVIENTLPAFLRAQELGCWGIELDVHATADGVLMVHHDPDLKRLWCKTERIVDLTFKQLRAIEPEVPSLEEVISACGKKIHLFIELKAPFDAVEALAQTLSGLSPETDYHLILLDKKILPLLSAFPKASILLVANYNNVKELCQLTLTKEYGGLLGNYLLVTKRCLLHLKNKKQKSGVGFINSKNSLYRELNRGVYWIFTNKAEKMTLQLKSIGRDMD